MADGIEGRYVTWPQFLALLGVVLGSSVFGLLYIVQPTISANREAVQQAIANVEKARVELVQRMDRDSEKTERELTVFRTEMSALGKSINDLDKTLIRLATQLENEPRRDQSPNSFEPKRPDRRKWVPDPY